MIIFYAEKIPRDREHNLSEYRNVIYSIWQLFNFMSGNSGSYIKICGNTYCVNFFMFPSPVELGLTGTGGQNPHKC